MKKKIRSLCPVLEVLEDRSVPAVAAVNLIGGNLEIATDAGDDTYTLNLIADNTIEVSDGGGLEGTFSGVTGQLTFTGLGGADNVVLNLNGFRLDAQIVASLGGDDDSFSINGGGGQLNGALNVDLNGDNDQLAIDDVIINNDIALFTGGGANSLAFGGVLPVVINGLLDIDAGDDGNQIQLSGTMNGGLSIVAGAGADDITIDAANIVGGIGITAGDGANDVTVTDSTIHGGVKVSLGDDNDQFTMDPVIVFGDLVLLTGGGLNTVTIDALYLSGGLLHYGGGLDDISITNSVLAGSSSFNMEGAGAAIDLTLEDTTLATFLSIVTGDEDDLVTLNNVAVGQNFSAIMGGGTDVMDITAAQIQGDVHHEGDGAQVVAFHDSQILGFVSLNTGVADDTSSALIHFCDTTMGRWLSILSGTGDDIVTLLDSRVGEQLAVDLTDGSDSLAMSGVAVVEDFRHFGAGDQDILLEHTQVDGFISLNFGASADTTLNVDLDTVSVQQFLSIRGGSSDDDIQLVQVSVAENLAIDTGAGEDSVGIDNGLVTGATTIDTGDEADVIAIWNGRFQGSVDVNAGDGDNAFFVDAVPNGDSTTFLGSFHYEGGNDDDTVTLGDENLGTVDFAIFAGSASFEGGSGTNTLNIEYALFAQDPAIDNFTVII